MVSININTASESELQTLHEIGSSRAALIVSTRQTAGQLSSEFLRGWKDFPQGFWARRLDEGLVVTGESQMEQHSELLGESHDSKGTVLPQPLLSATPVQEPAPGWATAIIKSVSSFQEQMSQQFSRQMQEQAQFNRQMMELSKDLTMIVAGEKSQQGQFMVQQKQSDETSVSEQAVRNDVVSQSRLKVTVNAPFRGWTEEVEVGMMADVGELRHAAATAFGTVSDGITLVAAGKTLLDDRVPLQGIGIKEGSKVHVTFRLNEQGLQAPSQPEDSSHHLIGHPEPDLQGAAAKKTQEQLKLEQAADLRNQRYEQSSRLKPALYSDQHVQDFGGPLLEQPLSHPVLSHDAGPYIQNQPSSGVDPAPTQGRPAAPEVPPPATRRAVVHPPYFGVANRAPRDLARRHEDWYRSASESGTGEEEDDASVHFFDHRQEDRHQGRFDPHPDHVRQERSRRDNARRRALPSLPQPKLPTFEGKADSVVDWRAFISQFRRLAARHRWNEEEKLDRLVECLRDKALVFFSRLEAEDQNSFHRLCDQLQMRFQKEETPAVLLKQLQELRQQVEEPIEEFASRTQQLAQDAFPQFGPAVVQPMAVDAFLRGCRDKLPAFSVMNQGPPSVQEALRLLRKALSNQTAVFGAANPPRVRQLRFLDEADEEAPPQVRAVQLDKNTDLRLKKTEGEVGTIKSQLEDLREQVRRSNSNATERLEELKALINRSIQSVSPKPPPVCFRCHKQGHISRECPEDPPERPRSPSPSKRNDWQAEATCFNCQKPGHLSRDCREPRRPRSRSPSPGRSGK